MVMSSEARPDFLRHWSVDASGVLNATEQFLQLEAAVLQSLQGVPEVVKVGHHPVKRVLRAERSEHLAKLLPACMWSAEALLTLAGIGEVWLAACSAHHVGAHVRALTDQAAVFALTVLAVRLAHRNHALNRRVDRRSLSRLRAVCVGRRVAGMLETILVSFLASVPVVVPSRSGRSSVFVALSAVRLAAFLRALLAFCGVPLADDVRLGRFRLAALLLLPSLWVADAAGAPVVSWYKLAALAFTLGSRAFWFGNIVLGLLPTGCE